VCYWRGLLRERYIVTIVGVSMIRRLRVVIFKDHRRMRWFDWWLGFCDIVVVGVRIVAHE
jgi:hypothetical protein